MLVDRGGGGGFTGCFDDVDTVGWYFCVVLIIDFDICEFVIGLLLFFVFNFGGRLGGFGFCLLCMLLLFCLLFDLVGEVSFVFEGKVWYLGFCFVKFDLRLVLLWIVSGDFFNCM